MVANEMRSARSYLVARELKRCKRVHGVYGGGTGVCGVQKVQKVQRAQGVQKVVSVGEGKQTRVVGGVRGCNKGVMSVRART